MKKKGSLNKQMAAGMNIATTYVKAVNLCKGFNFFLGNNSCGMGQHNSV